MWTIRWSYWIYSFEGAKEGENRCRQLTRKHWPLSASAWPETSIGTGPWEAFWLQRARYVCHRTAPTSGPSPNIPPCRIGLVCRSPTIVVVGINFVVRKGWFRVRMDQAACVQRIALWRRKNNLAPWYPWASSAAPFFPSLFE